MYAALATAGYEPPVLVEAQEALEADDVVWWVVFVGFAYAVLMVLLPYPVFEGNPGAACRVLLPMTVAFNVMLPQSRWFWPLFVAGNVSILQGLEAVHLWRW